MANWEWSLLNLNVSSYASLSIPSELVRSIAYIATKVKSVMSVGKPSRGRIGLGTYRLGAETFSACLKALEIGYRHIDTASLYRNEKQVAEAVKR